MSLTLGSGLTLAKTYVGIDDPDAANYIALVEAADTAAGSPGGLETATKVAIHSFVKGCKQDGIWSAIKASCILAGARTLDGALVPLVGTAPTNFNFVSGDYNRKTGLVGNGSTKYLNSNRNNNADPQNSQHLSIFASSYSGSYEDPLIAASVDTTPSRSFITLVSTSLIQAASRSGAANFNVPSLATGLTGVSRGLSSGFTFRHGSTNYTNSTSSNSPSVTNILLYRRPSALVYSASRLAFYSIGESIDLALLDARVTDLITAIGVAF